nr:MAG TPA: hypothetical protein [Caudoviricetes sp.]
MSACVRIPLHTNGIVKINPWFYLFSTFRDRRMTYYNSS